MSSRIVGESSTGVWFQDDQTGMFWQLPHPRKMSDEERERLFDPIANARAALALHKQRERND